MTYASENAAIEQRLLDNWTTYPVQFGEETVVDPDTLAIVQQPSDSPWVRLTISGASEEQAALGGSTTLWRTRALIIVQVFAPEGERQTALGLADTIAAIYRGASFSGISCQAATVRSIGKQYGWQQYNVEIPFYRDSDS